MEHKSPTWNAQKSPYCVLVSDGNVNLAEGRRAFQSTTNYLGRTIYNASLAVDGNTTARFLKGECAQTGTKNVIKLTAGTTNVTQPILLVIKMLLNPT